MKKSQYTKHAIYIATGGVATISLVAFIISYSALQQTASLYGFSGWQSWLWPLLIDLPILVFAFTSLVIGWLTGHRSWFATSMIVLFSGATILFNLAHAELHWLNYAVAIMPPLALIVSFEALRELIQIVASLESVTETTTTTLVASQQTDVETQQDRELSEIWAELDEVGRWNMYLELKGTAKSDTAIASELGCNRSVIAKLKTKFEKPIVAETNGLVRLQQIG